MTLSRLQADALLLLVAMIWGTAFVAQKTGAALLPPLSFVAIRFGISALTIAPFAWRENKRAPAGRTLNRGMVLLLACVFTFALILQQAGIAYTSVANASFLTGLYVIAVPVIAGMLYRMHIPRRMYVAAALSFAGVFFLSGGMTGPLRFSFGDTLIVACALGFALHLVLTGRLMAATPRAFSICFLQYAAVTLIAGVLAFGLESPTWAQLQDSAGSLLYLGIVSGGFAYTMQAVAQRYTPPTDAAIILGGEALFGALAGIWFLGERLDAWMWAGGGIILVSMLIVEIWPAITAWRASSRKA